MTCCVEKDRLVRTGVGGHTYQDRLVRTGVGGHTHQDRRAG